MHIFSSHGFGGFWLSDLAGTAMATAKGIVEWELPWVASPESYCPPSPGVPDIHHCQDEEMTRLAKRSMWKFDS